MPAGYKRRTILINKPFQIRVAFYVCAWLVAVFFVYPLLVNNLFDYFVMYARQDPNGPPLEALFEARRELLRLIVLSQAGFLVLTFISSLFLAHRIAGPIHKLKIFMNRVREGNLSQKMTLRKSDHFLEIADQFNNMTASVRARVNAIASRIETISAHTNGPAKQELDALALELRNGLGRE